MNRTWMFTKEEPTAIHSLSSKPTTLTDAWLEHHKGQYEWKQQVENLVEITLISPFNINANYTIPAEVVWDALKTKAAIYNIDIGSAFCKL